MSAYVQVGQRRINLDYPDRMTKEDRELLQQHLLTQWCAYVDKKTEESKKELPGLSSEESKAVQAALLLWSVLRPNMKFKEGKKEVIPLGDYTCEYLAFCTPATSALLIDVCYAKKVLFKIHYRSSRAGAPVYEITPVSDIRNFSYIVNSSIVLARTNRVAMLNFFQWSTISMFAFPDVEWSN